jgi:hypothetical protein
MKNMKLIMESWRNYITEDDQQEYDDLRYSVLGQVEDDLEEVGMDWILDDGVRDDIQDLAFKNNNLSDLIKSIKVYFSNEEAQASKWGYKDLQNKVLNELPPEVQSNLQPLGEDSLGTGLEAAAATEEEGEDDRAALATMEEADEDKDGAPAAPKWSKKPGKKAPKWADQDDSDPKVGDKLEEENSFSDAAKKIEKKGTEGVFTAKAKKAGKSVQAYAKQVLAPGSKASTKTKRQAAFAKGAKTIADKK